MVGLLISKVGISLMNMESKESHRAYIFTAQRESKRILGTAKWLLDEIARRETDAERSLMHSESLKHLTVDALACQCLSEMRAVIQNEYGNVNSAYGAAVKPYIKWPASMATSLDTGVPWVMCQRIDAPDPRIHTTSDSPAGKSTYSLIREPGELVKIKYTDVPLLYYTEILSMPEIIRLIMATVGRGGHGDLRQRIRDEILLIQGLSSLLSFVQAMMAERGPISRWPVLRSSGS
ncbi:hypothetical protein Syun_016558 [Stephania yunnanensis]|uniref:Uncharacterized protein n=1 Tax=Stephania yunnanensis TaxID=152371 RepID=A0AAP0J549_9MAGN